MHGKRGFLFIKQQNRSSKIIKNSNTNCICMSPHNTGSPKQPRGPSYCTRGGGGGARADPRKLLPSLCYKKGSCPRRVSAVGRASRGRSLVGVPGGETAGGVMVWAFTARRVAPPAAGAAWAPPAPRGCTTPGCSRWTAGGAPGSACGSTGPRPATPGSARNEFPLKYRNEQMEEIIHKQILRAEPGPRLGPVRVGGAGGSERPAPDGGIN